MLVVQRKIAVATFFVFVLVVFFFFVFSTNLFHDRVRDAWDKGGTAVQDHFGRVKDVKNQTLGFERIFVASMPDRTDKQDLISLAAAVTDFKFEFSDGVDGSKVPDKAIPETWSKEESNATYGCWRAHMNIAQRIIRERIQTALIIEDDADWDVHLKAQLFEFARGTRYILSQTSSLTHSPYGDNWDLLWLGHCGTTNRENVDQRYYVMRDDPTAIPKELWHYHARQPNLSPQSLLGPGGAEKGFNRVVYAPIRGLCTWSYALSYEGAKKLLAEQVLRKAQVSDRALNTFCSHRQGVCFSPYPAIIGSHKPAGDPSKGSDRVDLGGAIRKVGETPGVVFSTKLNLMKLVRDPHAQVESQWPGKTMWNDTRCDAEGVVPRGEGTSVTKEDWKKALKPT